jgi:hypothetical protein
VDCTGQARLGCGSHLDSRLTGWEWLCSSALPPGQSLRWHRRLFLLWLFEYVANRQGVEGRGLRAGG